MRYDRLGNLTNWLSTLLQSRMARARVEPGEPRFNPDDYVQKGMTPRDILCMVSKWLTGAYSNGSGVGYVGDTTFYSYDSYGNLTPDP